MATCAYIDLNPLAAGIATVPEESEHTSIHQRVLHVEDQGHVDDVKAAEAGSFAGVAKSSGLEDSHWRCPIEDRRGIDSSREGMLAGFTLGNYLMLVDYTSRLFRVGKASISRELSAPLNRLGSSATTWQFRLIKLREGRFLGRFLASSRERLSEVAIQLSIRSWTTSPVARPSEAMAVDGPQTTPSRLDSRSRRNVGARPPNAVDIVRIVGPSDATSRPAQSPSLDRQAMCKGTGGT